MAQPFTMPASETKNFREANYRQMRDFVLRLVQRTGEERRAWFQPDRSSLPAFERSIEGYREEFMRSIGYPVPHSPAAGRTQTAFLGEDDCMSVHRAFVPVCEGLDCYCLLLIPKTPGPHPLMMTLHGGGGCPDMVCDMAHTSNYNGAGRAFAKAGWFVCAPMLMFRPFVDGEQTSITPQTRGYLDRMCHASGTRLTCIEMFKIIRCIDEMLARPDVQNGRCAIAGLSYGGYYALMCAAVDKRIALAYDSCCFSDHMQYMLDGDRADTEFVWHDSERRFSFSEIGALVCPRPLIVEAGQGDAVFPIAATRKIVPGLAALYEQLGVGDRFHYVENGGTHEFVLGETMRHLHFHD